MKALLLSTVYSTSPICLFLWLNQDTRMALCVCVCARAQSCLTLCNPMDCSPGPGSSVHGIFQARTLEQVAILPDPGIKPTCHVLAGRFFTTAPPGKPILFSTLLFKIIIVLHGSNIKTQVWP